MPRGQIKLIARLLRWMIRIRWLGQRRKQGISSPRLFLENTSLEIVVVVVVLVVVVNVVVDVVLSCCDLASSLV